MAGHNVLTALVGTSLLSLVAAAPAWAQGQNQTYLDLEAGVGYSRNPDFRLNSVSSGFGRLSAYGYHGWGSERSISNVSAYVENSSYFRGYGNRQLFSLSANNSTEVSETVRLFGSLGFSGDFGAQLSSRFFGAPADTLPASPIVPDSVAVIPGPDLVALSQRQYRLNGSIGANFVLSPRDVISAKVGAERVLFKGNSAGLLDYNNFTSALAYQRQLNERVLVGARVLATRADYTRGRSILGYGPQVTADIKLDENLQLAGAVGFLRTERDLGLITGNRSSTDLAFDGSLCRQLEFERFCATASRRTQSVAIGSSPVSTNFGADYSRRLSARDQLQASMAYVTTGAIREAAVGKQTFYSAAVSFDRKINTRLSTGVNLAARKFTVPGPDPRSDLAGSLFIRNRFGSVR